MGLNPLQIHFSINSAEYLEYRTCASFNPVGLYVLTLFLKVKNVFSRSFFKKILALCMVSIQGHFIIKSGL